MEVDSGSNNATEYDVDVAFGEDTCEAPANEEFTEGDATKLEDPAFEFKTDNIDQYIRNRLL